MTTETSETISEGVDENKLISQRREKLADLRSKGNAFPNQFRRDSLAGELQQKYASMPKEEVDNLHIKVKVSGRMMLQRIMGKASFVQIKDMSGAIQLYVQRDSLAEGFYNNEFKRWDLGDIIGAEGELFKTNKDELSVRISDVVLLTT